MFYKMEESQGFEPWVPYGTLVFKTNAIGRSANFPYINILEQYFLVLP